ncbi:nucleoside triphosphate pyrophosphohydrolase [Haloparvum sedimenti]|uniref:nucleoside triphosphate pyrophosphohydrolase n=1 Tax=Haloparvum sedimenti TaxID=1678448 RepID=UPI00071E7549|nr:nucleoside triphosphate pyrophosphohydrolase [Haloparvum sedimenti]
MADGDGPAEGDDWRSVTEYDKLVRDEIPRIVREDGDVPETHVADDAEYERRLREKLVEEAEEFAESGDAAELGDVLDVVDAVLANAEYSREQVEALRAEKAAARGGFADRIVLDRVRERS